MVFRLAFRPSSLHVEIDHSAVLEFGAFLQTFVIGRSDILRFRVDVMSFAGLTPHHTEGVGVEGSFEFVLGSVRRTLLANLQTVVIGTGGALQLTGRTSFRSEVAGSSTRVEDGQALEVLVTPTQTVADVWRKTRFQIGAWTFFVWRFAVQVL